MRERDFWVWLFQELFEDSCKNVHVFRERPIFIKITSFYFLWSIYDVIYDVNGLLEKTIKMA